MSVALLLGIASVTPGAEQRRTVALDARPVAASLQSAAGQYVPVTPARLVSAATVPASGSYTVSPLGQGGIPSTNVSAVNVVVTMKSTVAASLVAYPDGIAKPAVTSATARANAETSTSVLAKLGPAGQFLLGNNVATATTVYVDVVGYYLAGPGAAPGSTYVPLEHTRVKAATSVAAGSSFTFTVAGTGGVPLTDVSAVALGVIASGTTNDSLVAYAAGTPKPAVASLTYSPGHDTINQVTTAVNATGAVTIHNNGTASATVYLDVAGYYAAPSTPNVGSTYVPVNPSRMVSGVSIAANGISSVSPLGKNGVATSGVSAVAYALTSKSTATGSVVAYSTGSPIPATASVYYHANEDGTNFEPTKLGDYDAFRIANKSTTTATTVWVDVHGYFKRPAVPGAPTAVGATAASGTATVNWTAPSDGGSAVTSYTVTSSPAGPTATTSGDTTATLTGLTNGTSYRFIVRATNSVGVGAYSPWSAAVVPGRVPGAPTSVAASPNAGSATVAWSRRWTAAIRQSAPISSPPRRAERPPRWTDRGPRPRLGA